MLSLELEGRTGKGNGHRASNQSGQLSMPNGLKSDLANNPNSQLVAMTAHCCTLKSSRPALAGVTQRHHAPA